MGKKYLLEIEENKDGGFAWSNFAPYAAPDLEQVRKEAYQQGYERGRKDGKIEGQAEAWVCAKKIAYMYSEERKKIFGENLIQNIHDIYSASEAIEKLKAYEQEKEMDGLRQNIQTIVDKCGYSLDEIATVLEKMRGEQDG